MIRPCCCGLLELRKEKDPNESPSATCRKPSRREDAADNIGAAALAHSQNMD